jgi:hypothetical protein
MKAYFTASIVGKRHHLKNYERIIETLKKYHVEVQSDHIIKTSEAELSKVGKDERLKFQKQLERWITTADFMVVETTFPSISVGYEISLAVHRLKPVLMLYSEGEAPSLLAHFKEEHVVCEKYTPDTLDDIISDFISYVAGTNDTRFTFFITSEIATFLDKVSRSEKLPKSVYLRHLIAADIEKRSR